jgi:DNA polymerase III subunit epsilon
MIEVVLDTETTGLSISANHRIVEIGCIELKDQMPTGKTFHKYINPQRPVSKDAYKIHGYTEEFLSRKKKFDDIADEFLSFIKDKKLIIHNAPFDLSFLNFELKKLNKNAIDRKNVIDTLEIARQKYPGAQNSLDALCKKFNIDNSKRTKHSALIDCELLKEVYINLVDQKEPKLNLENFENVNLKFKENFINSSKARKIIKPSENELELHKSYLKTQLKKNFYF